MKKSKPSEEQQITYALREVESGRSPADVCRQLSVSEAKSCIWKKKYAVQSRGVVPPLHARRPRPAPGADSTLAHARPRFGFTRIWVLLCREGWPVNKKRVRRLYRPDGLQLRMRVRRRKHIALHRGPAPTPAGPTERWSMDFVHDALADGRPFRVLTVVDQWSRQSPILEVASSLSGATVGQALNRCSRPRTLTLTC